MKLRGKGHEPWCDICLYSDEVGEFDWYISNAGLGTKLSGIVDIIFRKSVNLIFGRMDVLCPRSSMQPSPSLLGKIVQP